MRKISIVIPVYNGYKTLEGCLDSAISQDYENTEIIAVDDGSTDSSYDILKSYSQVITIKQKNTGVSAARNAGIVRATGDYIAFLDQDDMWSTSKLSEQSSCFDEGKNILFIFCDFTRYNYNNKTMYDKSNSELNNYIYTWRHIACEIKDAILFSGADIMELLLMGYPIYPSTMVINRKTLVDVGGWDNSFPLCQDFDISLRCCKYTNFMYLDKKLVTIGRHDYNVSSSMINQLEEDIEVLEHSLKKPIYTNTDCNTMRYYYAKRLCDLGWHYLNIGDKQKSRKYYKMSMKHRSWLTKATFSLVFTYYPFSYIKKVWHNKINKDMNYELYGKI